MKTFNVTNSDSHLFIQLKVDTIKKAFSKVYYIVRDERVKPHLAVSEEYENGSIDLDSNNNIKWKHIDIAGKFIGHELEFITFIENLPSDCNSNEKAKKYILENVNIKYRINDGDNANEYDLDEDDRIELFIERTGIIYKKIKIK
ncbi:hypothetical protein [Flavobacterium terrigena]|uniref:Uncharacterized protein n=1 Tax=Flavobacterium terrigena TaxID=402734 RepID=A0A1H6S9M8_9FLAO|nr:hypothetical protein [Flavobacterium terrigena]SEI63516.1 hypothetical protein SAMN05660918_1227 [Flavobacterium terrigena]